MALVASRFFMDGLTSIVEGGGAYQLYASCTFSTTIMLKMVLAN